jgi:hypothetical protein
MVEKLTVVLPLVWTFAPNAHPQPLQNLTVKCAIERLTRGYESLVHNSLDVEKLPTSCIAVNLACFFSATVNLATSTTMTAA